VVHPSAHRAFRAQPEMLKTLKPASENNTGGERRLQTPHENPPDSSLSGLF